MKAVPLFKEKRIVINRKTGEEGVAELKVWRIPTSTVYPQGRKFSLFLVMGGAVVIGFDNHKPKGPHFHLGNMEVPYQFKGEEKLLKDFWDLVRKAGFET
ncbi:MAG TPA: DUF6516 family protein [Bdellovibrionota bacterium]|nr:DUF6516 family protein [Bdellovibrionota bacterium]